MWILSQYLTAFDLESMFLLRACKLPNMIPKKKGQIFKLDKEISYLSKIGPRPNAENNMIELCDTIFLSRIEHPNMLNYVFSLY